MPTPVETLKERLYTHNALAMGINLMDYDHQCYMPPGGVMARARHIEHLTKFAHEFFVADDTRRAIENAEASVQEGSVEWALVRNARRDFDLQTKLPSELVARKARLSTEGHEIWVKARKANDFNAFAPTLEQLFDLAREEADAIGYEVHPYNALFDQYEEGATQKDAAEMFATLKPGLVKLVSDIKNAPNQPDDSFLTGEWSDTDQRAFAEDLARSVGYDFNRGKLDVAAHPFCNGFSIGDVRITTRFLPELLSSVYSTLHEAGHAMYEQGSPMEWDGTPLQGGVSLGVHESQSRLWENIVGRSRPFVAFMTPKMKERFPVLSNRSEEEIFRAANCVRPSFIRVEADEVTYNLHVMTRFELECDLLTKQLKIKDLPEAWNAKTTEYLGITPKTDSEGCMQDVHWSAGLIGYFPTYSMGNLLSYQIWNCLKSDLGDVDSLMQQGDFAPILNWLIEKVYQHGRRFTPKDLVQRVTGKPLGADDYIQGLTAKYQQIYSLPVTA